MEGCPFINFEDKEGRVNLLVMGMPEVLGELVAEVFTSGLPVDKDVTLFYTIYYPLEPHVYHLGTFLLNGIVCNSSSTLVICLYGCGRIVMDKLIQGGANEYCLFCIE